MDFKILDYCTLKFKAFSKGRKYKKSLDTEGSVFFVSKKLFRHQITFKNFDGDGQQNDTHEFSNNQQTALSE